MGQAEDSGPGYAGILGAATGERDEWASQQGPRRAAERTPVKECPQLSRVGIEDMRGGQGQSLTQREKVLVVLQHHVATAPSGQAPGGPTPLG